MTTDTAVQDQPEAILVSQQTPKSLEPLVSGRQIGDSCDLLTRNRDGKTAASTSSSNIHDFSVKGKPVNEGLIDHGVDEANEECRRTKAAGNKDGDKTAQDGLANQEFGKGDAANQYDDYSGYHKGDPPPMPSTYVNQISLIYLVRRGVKLLLERVAFLHCSSSSDPKVLALPPSRRPHKCPTCNRVLSTL